MLTPVAHLARQCPQGVLLPLLPIATLHIRIPQRKAEPWRPGGSTQLILIIIITVYFMTRQAPRRTRVRGVTNIGAKIVETPTSMPTNVTENVINVPMIIETNISRTPYGLLQQTNQPLAESAHHLLINYIIITIIIIIMTGVVGPFFSTALI
uniref:Uncharacterized protein n=1 Tax=Anopheles atroparvus TaxID=41427 RepID=A0A182IW36_ANOAO